MIKLLTLSGTQIEQFENYNELFDYLTPINSLASLAQQSCLWRMSWSFTVYTPKQVAVLYAYSKDHPVAMQEAFKENLPLVEICTGDYERPLYIVVRSPLDLEDLKKAWTLDYCRSHHLVIRE